MIIVAYIALTLPRHGTYTLDLPSEETEEFFRDVTREIKLAYQAGIIAGANASR